MQYHMTRSLLHHNGPPLTDLLPVMMDPRKLTPLGQDTRTHSPAQMGRFAARYEPSGSSIPF